MVLEDAVEMNRTVSLSLLCNQHTNFTMTSVTCFLTFVASTAVNPQVRLVVFSRDPWNKPIIVSRFFVGDF